MAKISLRSKVELVIKDDGKVIETFNILYKELSKKQQKLQNSGSKEIMELFNKSEKIDRQIEVINIKKDALEQMGNKGKELLKVSNDLAELYQTKDKIDDDFEAMGGFDKLLEASEATFDATVSGKDKDALKAFIEENGDYSDYLKAIIEDVKSQKGNEG